MIATSLQLSLWIWLHHWHWSILLLNNVGPCSKVMIHEEDTSRILPNLCSFGLQLHVAPPHSWRYGCHYGKIWSTHTTVATDLLMLSHYSYNYYNNKSDLPRSWSTGFHRAAPFETRLPESPTSHGKSPCSLLATRTVLLHWKLDCKVLHCEFFGWNCACILQLGNSHYLCHCI